MQSLRESGSSSKPAIEIAVAAKPDVILPAEPIEEVLPPKKRKVSSAKKEGPLPAKLDAADAKKKTQIRYDPDVPMSKEQLAAWRREARRVRNRESAAASRQRIRDRISELEAEVDQWKSKYTQAMDRLEHLERLASGTDT